MKKIRLGLISRIALLVVCVEIIAFSTLGWFYTERFSNAADERVRSRMKLVGKMIASNDLAVSAISRKTFMSQLLGAPYLGGMIIGGNGRIIVATDSSYLGRQADSLSGFDTRWLDNSAPAEQLFPADNTLTSVMRISNTLGGSSMYTAIITISTEELNARKRSIALWGQFVSLLFILLSSAGITLIAQRLITSRVNNSLKILKKVEDGEIDALIPVKSYDELGRLQLGINSMIEKVGTLLNQHRRNEEEMCKQKDLLASIIHHAPIRVFWKDRDSRYVGCNNQFAHDAGLASPEELTGKTDYDLSWREHADLYRADDRAVIESGIPKLDFEEPSTMPDGNIAWLSTSKVPLHGEGNQIIGILGIYTNITSRKKAEAKISELAFYDQLTGLPNRVLLIDRLRQAMKIGSRSGNYGALLFIDLDNFKTLNDTLGHDMGDLLLKQVAQRMQTCVRAEDTVARMGGDEFLILLANLGMDEREVASQVEIVGKKMLATLNQPYQLNEVLFSSTPSIGATLFRGHQAALDDLLKQADLAMYKSKEAGRNTLHFFNSDMEDILMERAALEKDMREALQEKQFLLHYQAQMINDSQATGAEALIRWQHPQRGMIAPADFIPLAEETGLILPLGQWVLHTACAQLALWAIRPEMAHLTVAVNVSAHQLRQADFVAQVLKIIKDTGVNPQRLKLELTESMLVSNMEDIIEKMFALKAQGVCFSLDDFGTGYSSLSYLRHLPLDQLKIDQSFVRDVLSDPNDATISKTIIALAQSLGLGVIAEGVETAAQRDFLAAAGCHAYQGYFFSKPLPLEEFEEFMQKENDSTK